MSSLRPDLSATEKHKELFDLAKSVMGFIPNSMLMMSKKPEVLYTFSTLTSTILNPPIKLSLWKMLKIYLFQMFHILRSKKPNPDQLPLEIKWMVAFMSSHASGCQYCQKHTKYEAKKYGLSQEKVEAMFQFENSNLFSKLEKEAMRFGLAAGSVPNQVNEKNFIELKKYFSENQILEMVSVVALFGFLNRWNDTLKTEIESEVL